MKREFGIVLIIIVAVGLAAALFVRKPEPRLMPSPKLSLQTKILKPVVKLDTKKQPLGQTVVEVSITNEGEEPITFITMSCSLSSNWSTDQTEIINFIAAPCDKNIPQLTTLKSKATYKIAPGLMFSKDVPEGDYAFRIGFSSDYRTHLKDAPDLNNQKPTTIPWMWSQPLIVRITH